MTIAESVRARRYLLQDATDQECAAVEREYLEHTDALDRMASVEDDLIEEYVTHQLSPGDRVKFERVYLAVPHRRTRVATIRRLMGRGVRPRSADAASASRGEAVERRRINPGHWLALAASLLFGACGGLWVSSPFGVRRAPTVHAETVRGLADSGAGAHAGPAHVVTLSSATSRSRFAMETVVVPAGTSVIRILLEGAGNGTLPASSASIRIPGGGDVWQGRVTLGESLPPGAVARADVPAATLRSGDYVVTLYGSDGAGAGREVGQYALRLRFD